MRIHCLALFLACSASQYPVFKVLRFKPKPEAQGDILPVPPSGVKNFFGKVSRSVSPGPARPACAAGRTSATSPRESADNILYSNLISCTRGYF